MLGWPALGVLATVLVAAPILFRLSAPQASSDIFRHAEMAAGMVRDGGGIAYSTWYPLLFAFTGGSEVPRVLRAAAFGLLILAVIARTLVSFGYARRQVSAPAATGIAVLACLMMPLFDPSRPREIYLGQVSANVWHNSTLLFAMPFSLLAFLAALPLLAAPSMKRALVFGLLTAASTSAKPNYTLALLPVVCLWLLVAHRSAPRAPFMTRLVISVTAAAPATALLAFQFVQTFGAEGIRDTHTVFAPLANWSILSPSVAVSVLVSVAGPVVAFLALPRSHRGRPDLVLAWLVLAVAMLQMAFLAEADATGHVISDGNYFWGAHAAMYVLFLVTLTQLAAAGRPRQPGRGRRALLIAAGLFMAAHALTGLYYVARAGVGDFPVTIDIWR